MLARKPLLPKLFSGSAPARGGLREGARDCDCQAQLCQENVRPPVELVEAAAGWPQQMPPEMAGFYTAPTGTNQSIV